MSALIALVPAVIFGAFELLGVSSFLTKMATSSCCKGLQSNTSNLSEIEVGGANAQLVVTDLTLSFCSLADPLSTCTLDSPRWLRIEKDLYLHTAQQTAWLQIEQTREEHLTADDLVVTEIRVGELHPDAGAGSDEVNSWERRPGGIWVLRSPYTGDRHQAVTAVDVLFGVDAVDPRPQWGLMGTPLQLGAHPEVPVARLTIRQGGVTPRPDVPQMPLRVKEDGKFKIVQIADTHMVTGVGVCKDAIDAHGNPLPERGADPLTVNFIGGILDVEKPDLVILTGDQLHHDILDSQSTLFKVVAPLIERSIPYAVVFGNHDDEGTYALSRMAQMSLYQDMPFSLCQSGPELVDGVGNYYLQIFAPGSSQLPLSTLYFLDSHGQIPSKIRDPDYDPIKQSQIDWFTFTSQALRQDRHEKDNHLSLAFIHIPIPEYADSDLIVRGGKRREPTEGPSFNSHFYDALTQEGIAVLGCGHDHVNDFCALRPPKDSQQDGDKLHGPWLCYGGGSGFGGYCSYGDKRYHRRTRVFELDTRTGGIKTWKRVEYAKERIDELDLVDSGKVVDHTPAYNLDGGTSAQVVL